MLPPNPNEGVAPKDPNPLDGAGLGAPNEDVRSNPDDVAPNGVVAPNVEPVFPNEVAGAPAGAPKLPNDVDVGAVVPKPDPKADAPPPNALPCCAGAPKALFVPKPPNPLVAPPNPPPNDEPVEAANPPNPDVAAGCPKPLPKELPVEAPEKSDEAKTTC